MIPSLNEINSHARKAGRGAGLSWGLADEAGRAASWLWEHGLDSLTPLVHLYDTYGPEDAQAVCPLHRGTRFCDSPPSGPIQLKDICSPILLLSFIAELAKITDASYILTFGQGEYGASPSAMYCKTPETCLRADVTLISGVPTGDILIPTPRRAVDSQIWERLSRYAHRTYAPATEASRLVGAGAGLSDND